MNRALQIAAFAGIFIALWVLYLYRKRRLREDHAILWLLISLSIILLSIWPPLIEAISFISNTANVTVVVLASFTFFLLLICIYYSMKLSDLAEQNKRLAQEIAILKFLDSSNKEISEQLIEEPSR